MQILCERIVVSRRDEIAFMQRWLRERGAPVPDADMSHDMMPSMDHATHAVGGAAAEMGTPGMLTAEQLVPLERARGRDFDGLFLASMIRRHRGAVLSG